jgi:hypothetical protein
MIRAFQNTTRVATAVVLADGQVLQVYPRKQKYESEEAFKSVYPEHEFRTEERVAAQAKTVLTGRMRAAEKHVLQHTSLPRDSDTPMQRLVRQIYFETSTADSIRATATDYLSSYYGSRVDPGIYVQVPETGIIYPVHFNRKSGLVLFQLKIQNENTVEGLRFYRKDHGDLIPVTPSFHEQQPGQKAVVIEQTRHFQERASIVIEKLRQSGFYIVHYQNNYRPTPEIQKAMYHKISNLMAIFGHNYNAEFYIHPSLEKLDTPEWWKVNNINIDKWISENK